MREFEGLLIEERERSAKLEEELRKTKDRLDVSTGEKEFEKAKSARL